jgi:tetratricopeptide (TPR) repeat protein
MNVRRILWQSIGIVGLSCALGHPGAMAADKELPSSIEPNRVAELIEQLGADDFFAREQAQLQLAKMGLAVFESLVEAENHPDPEVAARVRYLVRLIRVEWVHKGDSPDVQRLLDGYERLDANNRMMRMEQLAALPDDTGLEALCRLARFEKSPLLSKRAAILVLTPPSDAAPRQASIDPRQRHKKILDTLQNSNRPACQWLKSVVVEGEDPQRAVNLWDTLIKDEISVMEEFPAKSSAGTITSLIRYQISLQRRLGQDEQAVAAMQRLLDYELGEPESLTELIRWLSDAKGWAAIDKLAQRFEARVAENPLLAYTMAEARTKQGQQESAEEWVHRALELHADDPKEHLEVAQILRDRGMQDWAEREFRKTTEIGPAYRSEVIVAQFLLGELLYDQQRFSDAAKIFDAALTGLDSAEKEAIGFPASVKRMMEQQRARFEARKEFYLACAAEQESDYEKQAKHLDAALEADATDIDVLIAMFHSKLDDADRKEQVVKRIRSLGDQFRGEIQRNPNNPTYYNQLAWLVSNTEGDFREAVRLSQRSLELRPNESGYLDTLGRCLFANGQYAEAVKYQRQAVQGDPHSGQMQRQLELFEKTLAEAKQESPAS